MEKVFRLLCRVAALLVVMDVFEFIKALASTLQGDTLPKNQKRLTLNPFSHFEPIGFLLFFFCGFGWGKPVETSKAMYKNKRAGQLITYTAPMAASLFLAFILNLFIQPNGAVNYMFIFMEGLRDYFVFLTVCNLVPIPPMCGSKILCCFLSPNGQVGYARNERLFQTLFVFLMLLGFASPIITKISNVILSCL